MRCFVLLALLLSVPAQAAETITYTYDARGRLKQVARSGTVNNGVTATYTIDKADNRTNVTVTDGGSGPPSFSINDVSVAEGGSLVFTVTKAGTATVSTAVNVATANGTAISSDYTAALGTLTFDTADTTKTITVATIDDTTAESSETVLVNLSASTGGATISDAQGVGTIIDNDTPSNLPPIANTDSATVEVCGTVSKNVIANDTDPDGNYPLQLTAIVSSTKGMATVESNTNVSYTAFGNTGNGVVKYTVRDSLGAAATGTLNVNITSGICQ